MNIVLVILTVTLVFTTSVIAVVAIDRYKVNTLKSVVSRLADLISLLDGIGLDADFMSRYDKPRVERKIRIICASINSTTEKVDAFMALNEYVKFIPLQKAHGLYNTYKLNVDRINMTMGALKRAISFYGVKSEKVTNLVKRYDRIMVVSIDGLRCLLKVLNDILDKYK